MTKAKTTLPVADAAVAEEEKADVGQLSKDGKTVTTTNEKKETGKKAKAEQPASKPFEPVLTFTSPLKNFSAALAPLARAAAPAKSTYPICANVLLSIKDGKLTMVTTNMELTIVITTEVQVQPAQPGLDAAMVPKNAEAVEVTLPYRLLADLVGTLSGDTITIAMGEDRANVKCGTSQTELMGIPAKEFPGVEKTVGDLPLCFSAGDFKQAALQVEYAAATDESRPVLQGVQFTPAYNANKEAVGLTLAATDGFRVAVKTLDFSEPPEGPVTNFTALLPASALAEVGRLITDPESFVAFGFKAGKAIFKYGNLIISCLTLDGKFPDVNAILPRGYKTHMLITTTALAKSVKQTEVIAKNGNNVVRLTLDTSNPELQENLALWAQSSEAGEIETKLVATVEGPGLQIAFNVRFVREALEQIKTPQVALDTNDHKMPARIKGVGDDSYFVVIMPMHVG